MEYFTKSGILTLSNKAMSTPIIVEFVGLPGSGKSTIANQTASKLAEREVSTTKALELSDAQASLHTSFQNKFMERVEMCFRALLESPTLAIISYGLLFRSSPTNFKNLSRGFNFPVLQKLQTRIVSAAGLEVGVLAEGPLHNINILTLTGRRPTESEVGRIIRRFDPSITRIVITINTPVEICLNRVENRDSSSRFNQWNRAQTRECMESYLKGKELIFSVLEKYEYGRQISVDGTDSMGRNVDQIIEAVEAFLDSHG